MKNEKILEFHNLLVMPYSTPMLTNWIDRLRPRHLRLLIRLCETGNLTEVANEYGISQPALSKWLKDLEDDIGQRLFVREPRGVTPTACARELQAHARAIIGRLERARTAVDHIASGFAGHLSVGFSPVVGPVVLPESIRRFRAAYPDVLVSVIEASIDLLLPGLRNGDFDIVVGRLEEVAMPEDVRCETLYDEPVCLVAGRAHPLAGRRRVSWEDAQAYPWISPQQGTPLRMRLEMELALAGQPLPRHAVESTSVQTNVALLDRSDMIAPMSRRLAEHFQRQGVLRILPLTLGSGGPIGMLWRADGVHGTHTAHFIACLRQAV
ncbi:LysR substrate-binding domain protein [Bordetella bronchiseptica SBL-F6116]|nr:LysR substrate-binding domain protein [Bordetella bronchiseptica 00-P-2730]KDD97106.1 LysR substrate-binding domain protein [Bordetella bronchiseptica SBL-F6116]